MRKNNPWSIALIVLGIFLLATDVAFSQSQGIQSFSASISHQRIFYRAISSTAEVDTAKSDSTAPVKLLQEPSFTSGESNDIFWEPLPDTVYVIIGENGIADTLAIPIDDENYDPSIYIYVDTNKAALGNINKSPDVKVDPRTTSVTINNQSRLGHLVYYYPRFVFVYGNAIYKSTGKIDSSFQDAKPPTVESMRTVVAPEFQGNNGWIKTHDFDIHYYGLTDTSGLDSAFLTRNGVLIDSHDLSKYNRKAFEPPITSIRLDSFFISLAVEDDGEYFYTLGACDAAYTPGSHGAGANIDSFSKILGKCGDGVASDTVRIDTQPPTIDWSSAKDLYSSADIKNGAIHIPVKLYDSLSGIDLDSLSAEFTPPLNIKITVDSTRLDTFFIILSVQNIQSDTVSMLDLSIADLAGNVASSARKISFIVEAPQLTNFSVTDLDADNNMCLKPATNFTNNTMVQLGDFVISENKAVDSLHIIGADSSMVLVYPDDGVLNFDIANVIKGINSGNKLSLTINAIDNFGNEQSNGPTRYIFFDNEISAIDVTVRDISVVDTDARNGAYPGWTNSQSVMVSITSPDSDLFAIKKIAPDTGCQDAASLEFADEITHPKNKRYTFTFQVGDSAGNTTSPASFEIEYDDQIYQPDSSDFTAAYRSTKPGSGSENDSVYIIFNKPEQVLDLSRMVVNEILYSSISNNRVTVPLGDADFAVSLVDLAGNESRPVNVKIDTTRPVISVIHLNDLNDSPQPALPGFSDSLVVFLDSIVSDDVDSMNIAGEVKAVLVDGVWQELPGTIAYRSPLTVRFDATQGLDTLTASCMVRDIAGNWSDTTSVSIIYLAQTLTVNIDAPDTLTLAESEIPSDSLYFQAIHFSGDYPAYIRSIVTGDKSLTLDTVRTNFDLNSCDLEESGYLCDIPFKISQSGKRFVSISDSAGNVSNKDSVYFDVQIPPDISLTLFDYSEFPIFTSPDAQLPDGWQESDSLFTDDSTLVVLTHLNSGDWDFIRIALPQKLSDATWAAVANPDSSYDLREISLPEGLSNLETVTLSVQVKNKAGLTDSDSCTIVFDREAPSLTFFREAEKRTTISDTSFHFTYSGDDTSPGELAGIIIGEKSPGDEASDNMRYQYIREGEGQIYNLTDKRGEHVLTAFLVDKADVDQNRWNKSRRLDRNDLSTIHHKSDALSYVVRLNPVEVSNFPNPFNPENGGVTNLMFPLSGRSRVRITILDPFGNLVKEWEREGGVDGLNSGDLSNEFQWNGRNGEGKIVANGGYICIIDALDTGEKYIRKIAVCKTAR